MCGDCAIFAADVLPGMGAVEADRQLGDVAARADLLALDDHGRDHALDLRIRHCRALELGPGLLVGLAPARLARLLPRLARGVHLDPGHFDVGRAGHRDDPTVALDLRDQPRRAGRDYADGERQRQAAE
jgi:hypothetical protein